MATPSINPKVIFDQAVEIASSPERAAFLDRACADRPDLREKVEALLAAYFDAGSFLEGGPPGMAPTANLPMLTERTGSVIGPYKLLQQIGEGGFGVVYMAEQMQPVRRKVALKIIKPGMDTKEVVARFEAERQALALMDHPNIARVLDGGATEMGRPYFVMELVKGVPLTQFCDENRLDTKQRLELFATVCKAIQHAHQKGVIHRDIKPSNVMVTLHDGRPVPKVIDFGVAKAITHQLTARTMFTAYGEMIGTPQYMSPEQAEMSGLDIDTRSDVYSLGVLLYELLTGTTPLEARSLRGKAYAELQRMIREDEAPRPSLRISTLGELTASIATQRGTDPKKLGALMRGELDWIVMKALEKNRDRRYSTPSDFASDVERFLNHEAVQACPPSVGYKFRKFARRNKPVLVTAAMIAVILIAASVVSTWQAIRANQEAARANHILDELRASAPAIIAEARSLVAKDRFNEAIEKVDNALRLRPDEFGYLEMKGNLLQSQLRFEEAAAVYREVLKRAPEPPPATDRDSREPRKRPAEQSFVTANLDLSDQLSKTRNASTGEFSLELLAELHRIMQLQKRSAAEIRPIAKLLGKEGETLREYWLDRLRELPVGGTPLEERLTLAPTGRLILDLSDTAIVDLAPLRGMPLGWLSLSNCGLVLDLEPLRGMPLRTLNLSGIRALDGSSIQVLSTLRDLRVLDLSDTSIDDLTPLKGLRLVHLNLTDCPVSDLTPLAGMAIEWLNLRETAVPSLAPLQGMPLQMLDVTSIPATDFEMLAGAPIGTLYLQRVRVRDFGFLKGMPIRALSLWGCNDARNYAALADIESLEVLILPDSCASLPEEEQLAIDALEQHARLRQVSDDIMGGMLLETTRPKRDFWPRWKSVRELRKRLGSQGLAFTIRTRGADRLALTISSSWFHDLIALKGNTQVVELVLAGTSVSDLSPLKGVPLKELWLANTRVSDLEPLRGMKLAKLDLYNCPVADLSPLAGMPLETVYFSSTNVKDVSPLKGMPLQYAHFDFTEVSDVSPLAHNKNLQRIMLPLRASNIEVLKSLPNLQYISFRYDDENGRPSMTADAFWAAVEKRKELGLGRAVDATEQTPLDTAIGNAAADDSNGERLWAAAACVLTGRPTDHAALCELTVRDAADSTDASVAERCARSILVNPATSGDLLDRGIAAARRAVELRADTWTHGVMGMAEFRTGNFAEATKWLDLAKTTDDWRARAQAHAFLAMAAYRQGDLKRATDNLHQAERALGLWSTIDLQSPFDTPVVEWLEVNEARKTLQVELANAASRPRRAIELQRQIVAEKIGDTTHELHLAVLCHWLNYQEEHRALCRDRLSAALAAQSPIDQERAAKAYLIRSDAANDPTLLQQARTAASRALNRAQTDKELAWLLPFSQLCAGIAAYRNGDDAQAESHLTQALSTARGVFQATALLYRALVRCRAGDVDKARGDLAEARKVWPSVNDQLKRSQAVVNHDQMILFLAHDEAAKALEAPAASD